MDTETRLLIQALLERIAELEAQVRGLTYRYDTHQHDGGRVVDVSSEE